MRNVIAGEQQDQRPRRLRPFRRHAVPRQVARHQVQQPGHRRRAGEPQDRDGAQVVDGAEDLAEHAVREIRERAAGRGAALARMPRAGSAGWSRTLLPISSTLMISAAVRAASCVLRMRPAAISASIAGSPLTSGITATPVSNPDSPSASFGKTQQRGEASITTGCRAACTARCATAGRLRVRQHFDQRRGR